MPDPNNELGAWTAARTVGLELWCGDEPLGEPADEFLAQRTVERRMLVTATAHDLIVDFSLVMGDFDFETVWRDHAVFEVEGVEIPVASLGVDVAPRLKILKLEPPPKRQAGRKVGSVQELVQVLHNEAKVI